MEISQNQILTYNDKTVMVYIRCFGWVTLGKNLGVPRG